MSLVKLTQNDVLQHIFIYCDLYTVLTTVSLRFYGYLNGQNIESFFTLAQQYYHTDCIKLKFLVQNHYNYIFLFTRKKDLVDS
jgi:hypothetical protein